MSEARWHSLTVEEAMALLETRRSGLTEEEAAERLRRYGPNELRRERGKPLIWMFLKQFKNMLIAILVIATVISAAVAYYHEEPPVEAATILAMVFISAILGFIQEYRSEKALELLKRMAAPTAKVLRGGKEQVIPARELVPGDVVLLHMGDRVPADMRLMESINLRLDEAPLTGESTPVSKVVEPLPKDTPVQDRRNIVYCGTTVVYGRGVGVVVSTGMNTEFGRIAAMVQAERVESTPLERRMASTGRWLGILSFAVSVFVALIGVLVYRYDLMRMLVWALSLAVAAVPEALPAVVTVSLAIGVHRMAKRNAVVRRLPAVETLGCTTVICSDKTGTMTKGEMTVREIYLPGMKVTVSGTGYEPKGEFRVNGDPLDPSSNPGLNLLLRSALLCNDAKLRLDRGRWVVSGDPTEGALVVLAAKAGMGEKTLTEYPRIGEVPFTSERKMMTTFHKAPDGGMIACLKGAPEVVLERCDRVYVNGSVVRLTEELKRDVLKVNEEMAGRALRNLGIAYKRLEEIPERFDEGLEQGFIFLGLTGMIDPPREEVVEAIEVCKRAGVRVVMVTGDHKLTAVAVAKELGLLDESMELSRTVVTGVELDRMSDEELAERVEDIVIYARVLPEHKVRIVDALKKRGHVVAMTGDGVNDAPALKKADIGVAMGITGTDVTKEASDMTLADDNFATIVAAVEEGRGIFANIRKYLAYLLSANIGEILIVFIASILGLPLPLTATQILWINVVTDGLPAMALSIDPSEPDLMLKPPRDPKESVFTKAMKLYFIGYPSLMCAVTLLLFWWALQGGLRKAMTLAFTLIIIFEMFDAQNVRSFRHSIFKLGPFSNRYLVYAIASSLALQALVMYIPALQPFFGTTPLTLMEWLLLTAAASTALIGMETAKLVRRAISRRQQTERLHNA